MTDIKDLEVHLIESISKEMERWKDDPKYQEFLQVIILNDNLIKKGVTTKRENKLLKSAPKKNSNIAFNSSVD